VSQISETYTADTVLFQNSVRSSANRASRISAGAEFGRSLLFVYHCFSADEQNSEFLSIELNGADVENQLRRIVSSGARMDGLLNISFQEYVSVSVLLPTIEEQNKIADFFKNLDNLITLHQRELEKLKNFKKACLEKMFV